MFETIIALFIKRYVAHYFDINADQLSAQLLYKQQIVIENLTLNKTAFNEDIQTKFKLPINIESFHIGKIQCSFVLSSLFFRSSSPALIVKIEGVHAIVKSAIIDDDESLLKTSKENQATKKRNELNLAEQQLEKEFECFGEVKSSRWNVQRLLMSFCEKLQVEIVDVHICYESSALYTMGFTCESIHISNESSDETMSRQVLRVNNPGLYIDIHHSPTHSYLLSPSTSMEVTLTHNHFLISQKEYRYEFECLLNDLTLKCSVEQVRILADMIRSVQNATLRQMLLFDPSRPRSKISKQSAKAWWHYAILAVLRTQAAATAHLWFDRSLLIYRLHRLITYQRLYRTYLDNKYVPSEDELVMNEIEAEFDIKYLLIVRRSIFQKRIREQLTQKKDTVRWYSTYASWITTKLIDLWEKIPAAEETNTILNENDVKLQEQVNTFIAETLEDEDLSENCQNALIFRFKFILKSVQVDLLSSDNDFLFRFYLKNLSVTTEFRLRHRSIVASVSLEDLYIRDQKQVEAFAKIIGSKERSQPAPVFELSFEKKGRSKNSKQSVYTIGIRSCGLSIVCSPEIMERLHHFYRSTFGASSQTFSVSLYNWKQIKNYAVSHFISVLEQIIPIPTTSYPRHRRREKKKYQISIDIGAPKIVIPLSSQGALIVDLGSMILSNDMPDSSDVVAAVQENDEEEFLTPDSTPLTNDEPLEEQTTYYSINVIPTEIEYSSFSLSIHDIRVGYSIDRSEIVEKFTVHFLIEHPSNHLWPLVNISGTVQKMVLHLSPQILRTLCDSMYPWIALINNLVTKKHYQTEIWPVLNFRLDEISVQLNDESQALCDICMQNIDLSLVNNHHSKNLNLTLQTLAILDSMQQRGENYDFLLKTHRTSSVGDSFIRVNTNFSDQVSSLVVDVNADKLEFVFNPKTICALVNFLLDINLFSFSQSIFGKFNNGTNAISCKISSTFRELYVFVIDITSMALSSEIHLQNLSVNIVLNSFTTIEMTMTALQILDLLSNPEQSTTVLIIDHDALHLFLTNAENNAQNLSIKLASISYIHSLNIIDTVQGIFDHMSENCHLITNQAENRETLWVYNHFNRSTLRIDLNALKIIFPLEIALQFSPICIRNDQSFEYQINIDRLEAKTNDMLWPLLENIFLSFNLEMSDASIRINSRLTAPLRIFLSPHRIKLLQQILNTPLVRHTSFLLYSTQISSESQARKKHPIDISVEIDSISCLFQDDQTPLMNIELQRFSGQIHTSSDPSKVISTIQGQIGSISIPERLSTTGANAIVFTFNMEEDHNFAHSQFHLRLSSLQYNHTQSFLFSLIDYFDHFRTFMNNQQSHRINLNVEMENMLLILPEDISKKSVLIFQVGYIYFTTSPLNFITIRMTDIEFYSSSHYFSSPPIRLSMVRQPFHLNMQIERNLPNVVNRTSPAYIIKMNLSSLDVLLDFDHYRLIENIVIDNLGSFLKSFWVLKDGIHTDFACVIEIDHVGLEIFMLNVDLLSFDHRQSLGYAALTNLHLSFDQYTNGNQVIHLFCPTVTLIDTRTQPKHMLTPLSMPSSDSQLEVQLQRTKLDNQCTITMNSVRLLVVIDWLLALNEFLRLFCEQSSIGISLTFSEIKLNLNRFELVLVSTTKDPYASALVYSSTMTINYGKAARPLECFFTDFTFFTCQIGNIDETTVSIIEPTDCFLNIERSNELLDEQICELNIPLFNIRLSYSDVQMIYSLIYTISKQIAQAKTRKPLLTFISSVLTSPLRTLQASTDTFLNIKFLKLISDQLCVCLIDDCFGVTIPLLNVHLKPFILQTIENSRSNRTDQCEFDLNISYYNRFQSGFEPLIETCPLQMTLTRSMSSILLFLSSKEVLNLNFTKAMYRLLKTVQTNWLADYHKEKKEIEFRRVKPLDPYCFKNLLGIGIKFRTWVIAEQCFSSFENIVDDNQTTSFCFPIHSSLPNSAARRRSNSIVASLFQSDRRLLISIDGWEPLQPISIDRVGTFFRRAIPSNNQQLYKPILVIIDIAMTDSSIRSITIRSSIEIRNQLLTSIDMQLTSRSDSLHEFCLEPNETRSLPIQLCSTLKQIQVRPANFALDYCDESISWSDIETNSPPEENRKMRQSFLRTCSIGGKEAVYYVCLQSKQTCLLSDSNQSLCIYQLTILPPLTICNLLPCTLTFQVPSYPQKFELNAYKIHREHTLNILENLDILFATNLYHMNKPLHLPTINELHRIQYTHQRVVFYDQTQRELMVDITIECVIKYRLKISIAVPYVLLNKSGIPLIFKDANSKVEAAGQSTDDETMLNREPLLFSFDNSNRNNTCLMRVGTGLHCQQEGRPQWSPRFSIEHGSTYRQLQVRSPRSLSDWNYSIAIDVRPGHGQLKKINFIFLSARYIICNQCSWDLLIAQRPLKDDDSNNLRVSEHATVGYHWPRTDMEQLLCAQAIDSQQYALGNWSGGFPVDCINVFHINMRYVDGQCLILRVKVIERNGTYFVVFMDANQMPAPFRISNRSDVPVLVYQSEIREEATHLRTVIQPHQSMDYAWDEPTLKLMMTCSIIDGTKVTCDLLKLGFADDLTYQNYIYLALEETFHDENLMQFSNTTPNLVVEYIDNRLFLAKQQQNKSSQLWQMTNNGLLIHVGSSTTTQHDSHKKKESSDDIRQAMVLDLEDLTDHSFNILTVRRYDSKRALTQTWQLQDNGYLCLANTQMCVQVFGEVKENSNVVLGPIPKNESSPPLPTMHIRSHQRYRGSGILSVCVVADGPTNVLEIDHKKSNEVPIKTMIVSPLSTVYHLDLHFPAGVGISVVGSIGHESEELIYLLVNNLHIAYTDIDNEQSVEAKIDAVTISNQLLTTTKTCFLYASFTEDSAVQSAIRLQINWQKFNNNFTLLHIIHSLRLDINSITIQLDEVLLWKLIDFFDIEISSLSSLLLFTAIGIGSTPNADRRVDLNVNDYETERLLSLLTSTQTTRIYFSKLYLSAIDLNLSVCCIHSKRSLSPHLLTLKRHASFPLVPFENAQIHLKSYEQTHISNTYDFFLLSIMTYYINVSKRQVFKILGTVDFLGNPLGLIHDVSDGITCLVDQRSVSGLVKNVAHGVADSTSKVTGSLSHGIGKLVSNHDRRQTTTDHPRGGSLGHAIRHGTASLAAGLFGGVTSMIKQPYKGVVEDGVSGLVKGFAKGIVGTVSKPMVGILDFTNEMAMAIKETSRSSTTTAQNRLRLPRCPCNTSGLLQSYSIFDAQGHYLLSKMNKGDSTERYISRLTLSTTQINSTDKRMITTNNQRNTDAMITTQRIIFYQIADDSELFKFEILHSYDFNTSMTILPGEADDGSVHIQILLDFKPPIIHRCDTSEQVSLFCREVQRARDLFEEEKLIYIPSDDETEDFDE